MKEKIFTTRLIDAQAQLLQRASILMAAGVQEYVFAHATSETEFGFVFGDISLAFHEHIPYDQVKVDAAINALDEMIEERYRKAEHAITLINAWRG
jgi:hypothetical protein